MSVWVITWQYSDGSGFGIVDVYASEEVAKWDLERLKKLKKQGYREYKIRHLPVVGTPGYA